MTPLENFDRANLIGGVIVFAVLVAVICFVVLVLPLVKKWRAERADAAEPAPRAERIASMAGPLAEPYSDYSAVMHLAPENSFSVVHTNTPETPVGFVRATEAGFAPTYAQGLHAPTSYATAREAAQDLAERDQQFHNPAWRSNRPRTAREQDMERHDPTRRENRPYPRKTHS